MFNIFKFNRKAYSNANWQALIEDAGKVAAGIHVSPQSAMRCAPVFAAVRVRCETIGQLPVNLFKRKRDGGREKATDHPLHALLHDAPNFWTGASEFIEQLELDAIMTGKGGFALANRVRGQVFELIRLDPNSVTIETDAATQEPRYRVTNAEKGSTVYGWQDVLHVPIFGGFSPIRQWADAIGLCIAMEHHAGQIFAKGGRPSGILKMPGKIGKDVFERLKNSWNNGFAGEGAGSTAILEDGIDFKPLAFNSVDLQFMELRNFQLSEIARAFAVPPTLIADYGRATWSNGEQMAQHFLTFGILPRAKAWQGAIMRLLTAKERKEYYAEFALDQLVKADIAARFEAYSKAISSRILSPNEVRAKENLPAYEGGEEFLNPNIEASPTTPTAKPKPAAGLRVVTA